MAKKKRRTPARLSKWQKAELNRRERERDGAEPPARFGVYNRTEQAPDGLWQIRQIRAGASEKEYTCPGCHRMIPVGVAHLVAWREDHIFGADYGAAERRHWHSSCWSGRTYRYR